MSKNRKLASIQKINNITPIENADKIELCTILGWQCVVAKKQNFKIGDLVVYVEIDSQMPNKPEFGFLKDVKFRVKTRKFRGVVSQGLVLPISIIPNSIKIVEDLNLTEILGVTNYQKALEDAEENSNINITKKSCSKLVKYLMNYSVFRKIYFKFNTIDERGSWPTWISHTDEERLESCSELLLEHFNEPWYITEKLDGCSGTFFLHQKTKWGFPSWEYGVCSRNIWLKSKNNSHYWNVSDKYNLKSILRKLKTEIVIQCEVIGQKIQGNKYNIVENDLYVFNVIDNGNRYNYSDMRRFCVTTGLKSVPLVFFNFIPSEHIKVKDVDTVMKFMVDLASRKSMICDRNAEGIVCRLVSNPNISFKVINPNFLLEEK